jgi:para-aminobenzoate synthetase/4-amino-4-deoxychorismate lyase
MEINPGIVIIHDNSNSSWLKFTNPLKIVKAVSVDDVIPAIREVQEHTCNRNFHAAGFVSYEASPAFDSALRVKGEGDFPLVWFGIYEAPEEINIQLSPPVRQEGIDGIKWQPSISRPQYSKAVSRIKNYIRDGETYQVNFTIRLKSMFDGDPFEYFQKMVDAQQCRYGAYIDTDELIVCSASPEMFFECRDGKIFSKPMKGTVSRGLTNGEDIENACWLKASVKNRAENLMIVDMVRNDLGRIAKAGTVCTDELFSCEKYPTLWQMTSTVSCASNAGLVEVFNALFPPASITGAPKARTMEIIAELEDSTRKLYTGAIGFITPHQRMQFNVAIRTVIIDKKSGAAEYGVGGGIVWDSDIDKEYEECMVKAKVLTHSLPEFRLLESILWTPEEGYFLLDEHLDRMDASAEYFAYEFSRKKARGKLDAFKETLGDSPLKVRLLVNGAGGMEIQAEPVKPAGPIRVALAKAPVDSSDVFLYHKTTSRRVYESAKESRPDFDDVMLFNERGEITEGSSSNIVVEIGGKLFTPPVSCGLLAGTFRGSLIKSGRISERVIKVGEIGECSRIFFINSVRKWREAFLAAD